MPAQELSAHPVFGRRGPSQDGLLYKKSDTGELRPRYFQLKDRRLTFWADDDAVNIVDGHLGPKGQVGADQHDRIVEKEPRGYRDIIGASIRTIETCCDGPRGPRTNWFGVEIVEEYGVKAGAAAEITKACAERGDFGADSPLYRPGDKTELFHHEVEARDMWMDSLIVATRPCWVKDDDPRAATCMDGTGAFSLMDRRHHCRKCGGVFRRQALFSKTLPDLGYHSEVWVCRPCVEGTKPAGRWDSRQKLNTGDRGPRGVHEKAANYVKGLLRR